MKLTLNFDTKEVTTEYAENVADFIEQLRRILGKDWKNWKILPPTVNLYSYWGPFFAAHTDTVYPWHDGTSVKAPDSGIYCINTDRNQTVIKN